MLMLMMLFRDMDALPYIIRARMSDSCRRHCPVCTRAIDIMEYYWLPLFESSKMKRSKVRRISNTCALLLRPAFV